MIKLSAKEWNDLYPIGTEVIFESVRGRPDTRSRCVTRGPAYDTLNGTMVQLKGKAGGHLCTHMAPVVIAPREPDTR